MSAQGQVGLEEADVVPKNSSAYTDHELVQYVSVEMPTCRSHTADRMS